MRCLASVADQASSTWARGDGAGVDANGADRDLLGQDVQFGEVLAGAYRALATADELEAGRAEGGRGDLGGAPATEPISIQVSGRPRSERLVMIATMASVART